MLQSTNLFCTLSPSLPPPFSALGVKTPAALHGWVVGQHRQLLVNLQFNSHVHTGWCILDLHLQIHGHSTLAFSFSFACSTSKPDVIKPLHAVVKDKLEENNKGRIELLLQFYPPAAAIDNYRSLAHCICWMQLRQEHWKSTAIFQFSAPTEKLRTEVLWSLSSEV